MKVELSNGDVIYCHERHEWSVIFRGNRHEHNIRNLFTFETQELARRQLVRGELGKRGSRYLYQLPQVEPLEGVKLDLPVVFDRKRPVSIKSITYDPCGQRGHCITVDSPDGLYLVGNSLQPTHNSIVAEDFIAWIAGKHPDKKTIYASYAADLGTYRNANFQRMVRSPQYRMVFPNFEIGKSGWTCNSDQIDYCDHVGSFRNTTVSGTINGFEIYLGVLDDPIKGRAEALSQTISDRTWSWFTDDWLSRFSNDSAQLIIMTWWALNDVIGRYKETVSDLRIVEYPAFADHDDRYRKAGEPLFPALKRCAIS